MYVLARFGLQLAHCAYHGYRTARPRRCEVAHGMRVRRLKHAVYRVNELLALLVGYVLQPFLYRAVGVQAAAPQLTFTYAT